MQSRMTATKWMSDFILDSSPWRKQKVGRQNWKSNENVHKWSTFHSLSAVNWLFYINNTSAFVRRLSVTPSNLHQSAQRLQLHHMLMPAGRTFHISSRISPHEQ
jgi:hypothetical protein